MDSWYFILSQLSILEEKTAEHLAISLSAVCIAMLLGVPLGVWIIHQPRIRGTVIGIGNIFQTIPSLALFGFLIPFMGIGILPTIVALVIYAILPILRNTYTGLRNIPEACRQSAHSLGFTSWQRLRYVDFPLALPTILSGIRTAAAMTMGLTTIAAFIGAGGLGEFITQGLALNDSRFILLGAIPTATLALLLDYVLGILGRIVPKYRRKALPTSKLELFLLGSILIVALTFIGRQIEVSWKNWYSERLVIATQGFTEQYILGEIFAQLIESKTDLKVDRKFHLGSGSMIHAAMVKGDVDFYVEYSGSAYLNILGKEGLINRSNIWDEVQQYYQDNFNFVWFSPLGFSNAQTLAVRANFAKEHDIKTLSDLNKVTVPLIIGAPHEFKQRPDAMKKFIQNYKLYFDKVQLMDPNLMYSAIKNKDVNVIVTFTTDSRLENYDLIPLKDNKEAQPAYDAALVMRHEVLNKYPELKSILNLLSGRIDNDKMKQLNYKVDVKKHTPQQVAIEFLQTLNQEKPK